MKVLSFGKESPGRRKYSFFQNVTCLELNIQRWRSLCSLSEAESLNFDSGLCNVVSPRPVPVMCQWLSTLTTASGLSQEEFPLARAAGRARATGCSLTGQMAPLQLGERPPRIPATHCHCLHFPSPAKRAAVKTHTNTHDCTHTLNRGRGGNYPIIECHHI